MKCYYRMDGSEWVKGRVQMLSGTVHFCPISGPAAGRAWTLHCRPEVTFHNNGLTVTGHVHVDTEKDLYQLVSVDVSPGWVKPK